MRFLVSWVARFSALAILAMLLAALGCLSGGDFTQKDRLILAAREYNEFVRWRRFEEAAKFVTPEKRDSFIERHRRLDEDLQIADYEVMTVEIEKDKKDTAFAKVDYSWILSNVQLLQRTKTRQQWVYRRGKWLMDSEERVSGKPLVLFGEKKSLAAAEEPESEAAAPQ